MELRYISVFLQSQTILPFFVKVGKGTDEDSLENLSSQECFSAWMNEWETDAKKTPADLLDRKYCRSRIYFSFPSLPPNRCDQYFTAAILGLHIFCAYGRCAGYYVSATWGINILAHLMCPCPDIIGGGKHERGLSHACVSTSPTSFAPALELWWWWSRSSSSTEQEEGRRRPMISCRPRGPVAIVLVVLVAVRPPTEGSSTWVVGRSRWKWDLQKAQISLFKNRTDNAIYLNFLLLFFIGLWDLLISGLLYPMDQNTPCDFFPSNRIGTSYSSEAARGLQRKSFKIFSGKRCVCTSWPWAWCSCLERSCWGAPAAWIRPV